MKKTLQMLGPWGIVGLALGASWVIGSLTNGIASIVDACRGGTSARKPSVRLTFGGKGNGKKKKGRR